MKRVLSPAQFLSASFFVLIVAGTVLLLLPISVAEGHHISLIDALFTATSAVCVTGLIVFDIPNVLSPFGQVVLVLLVQAGGLGYMTLSTILVALLGKKLSLYERATLQEALNVDTREGLLQFAGSVLKMTLFFEVIGTAILAIRWSSEFGFGYATYLAAFHSISAFNNAGFSLFSTNLVAYRGDLTVNLVVTSLIIIGGAGFFVLRELGQGRPFRKLSLHSRLALTMTAFLLVGGTAMFYFLERSNAQTFGNISRGEALLAAYFQAVTPRTAGFNTIDLGVMTRPALFLTMILMFIGASPGGTGGGVKTTTFGVTVLALWSTVRGETEPVAFGRRIAAEIVARAFFISLLAFLALNIVAGLTLLHEGRELLETLFETTSAFGTVGLTMGHKGSVLSLSGHFTPTGKLLMVLMMFLGRVGPLTVAVALAGRRARPAPVRYPEGRVFIG